jgi:hypothetical protein
VFVDEFYRPKRTPKTLSADVDGSEKTFFQKPSQLSSLDTQKNCRHAATFSCRPCHSWIGTLQTLRHDRRNTNATLVFRVSLRLGGIGQNIDATPETLKYMGVAALRIFWGECLKTSLGNFNNFSL